MTFNSSKLSNGLTLTSYHMPHIESVAINLIVNVGSRYEHLNEAGISHFLEHMAFKGTALRSAKKIAEEFDLMGGNFNAYTSKERTIYFAKVLKNNLVNALDIIADIIQNSLFNMDDIKKEYQVILQEIAATIDDPDELVYEKFYEISYPNQPIGRSILGTDENLKNYNKDSFKNYLNKYYTANNMCLSVAGNVDHRSFHKLADKLFQDLPYGNIDKPVSASYAGGSLIVNKELEQVTLVLGFKASSYMDIKNFYTCQLLSLILGGGISSRLFQRIREDLGLAYSIGCYMSGYADCGIFTISAGCNTANLPLMLKNLNLEINKVIDKITLDEMIRAQQQIETSIYLAEEKSSYKSEVIGKNFMSFGKYISPKEVIDMVKSIAKEDIKATAKIIFSSKPTIVILGPEDNKSKCEELTKDFKINL